MSGLHPRTGRRYRQVFPWPTDIYCDWRSAYARLAAPWVTHHAEQELPAILAAAGPEDVVILWHDLLAAPPPPTKATLILYWPETVGSGIGMTAYQAGMLRKLIAERARLYRGVLFYDPAPREFLGPSLGVPTGVSPAGYDPEVMGVPDWTRAKTHDLALYGAYTGIREWLIPEMRARWDGRLDEFAGVHGKARAARLSQSKAICLVPHSPGSFPQWRLWHAVASSTPLLAPWPAAWPAVAEKHYVPLPFPDPVQPAAFLEAVHRALGRPDLGEIARRAHEDLSAITVERAFEDWTVPEIERMLA